MNLILQSVTDVQSALLTTEILARNFGAEDPEPFLGVIPEIISLLQRQHSKNINVTASCLVCLATLR